MKTILKHFSLFIGVFVLLFLMSYSDSFGTRSMEAYQSIATPLIKMAFPKANMYSEAIANTNENQSMFRIKMTNDAELQKQIKLARAQGLNKLNVDGKEFFVDVSLFWIMPLLLLVSLIFAAPMDYKSKIISLLVGVTLFTGYTLVRLYIMILDFLSNQVDIGIYQYNDFWSGIIENIAATQKAGFSALVAFIIALGLMAKFSKELQKYIKPEKIVNPQINQMKPLKNKHKKMRKTKTRPKAKAS